MIEKVLLELLTAISPLDGRYRYQLEALAPYFSEYGLIHHRVIVEIGWLKHLSSLEEIKEIPVFSREFNNFLSTLEHNFSIEDARAIKKIELITNHDVKAVEYWLKKKLTEHEQGKKIKEFVHFACTSEDINNISYALMLKGAQENILLPKLKKLLCELKNRAHRYAMLAMMSRTHGQPATPTTMGKEFANIAYRLERQINHLQAGEFLAKINGAVGNYNAHMAAYPQVDWPAVSQAFVEDMGLIFNPYTTQIEPHDYLAEYTHILSLINTILIDLNRDIWGYISLNYFTQKLKEGEVGSSTMPHKVNPIDFENSEGNLGLANSLLTHFAEKLPISRWQRDLSDSTVLRSIGSAIAYALLAYNSLLKGLDKLQINAKALADDVAKHWELLAEPIQTVMRCYRLANPYEQLKDLTRTGKVIDAKTLKSFIHGLNVPEHVKQGLLDLYPENYLGQAAKLAEEI